MGEFNTSKAALNGSPEQLSKLFGLNEKMPTGWSVPDLGEMFRHQLSAPLEYDLSKAEYAMSPEDAREALTRFGKPSMRTFGDLFFAKEPPLALLAAAKSFFKANAGRSRQTRSAEEEISYAFYLLAVVVARVRCGKSISGLSDQELLKGIGWALEQRWVDPRTRDLFAKARKQL